MSMSYHIKQQVLQEFFSKKVSFSWKTANLDYLLAVEAAWHTVLICCTMGGTEQPKEQPQIGDRGSNPVAINLFLFLFSIWFTCSRFRFHFFFMLIFYSLFYSFFLFFVLYLI